MHELCDSESLTRIVLVKLERVRHLLKGTRSGLSLIL